jgi:hypothetical protein
MTDRTPPMSMAESNRRAADQADGLRRLFASNRHCLVPVVSNAEIDCPGILLERLANAFTALGARTLVVDAAENAPQPSELIDIDLPASIEKLSPTTAYLAARGVPRRRVDARGSSEAWLSQVESAAPWADVVLVHAEARDMARLLGQREVHPVLLASLAPASLTDAYAAMKLLAQRCGLMSFDLLVGVAGGPRRGRLVVERLASTADAFLGGVLRASAVIDRAEPLTTRGAPDLARLAAGQLMPTTLSLDAAPRLPRAGARRPSLSY